MSTVMLDAAEAEREAMESLRAWAVLFRAGELGPRSSLEQWIELQDALTYLAHSLEAYRDDDGPGLGSTILPQAVLYSKVRVELRRKYGA